MQLNMVQLVGNLTADPEIRQTGGGTAVCNFRLAVNERYVDKTGERKEITAFINISAFGKTAENVGQYCQKGSQVYIQGKLAVDEWEKNGEKRSQVKVNAQSVQFMTSGKRQGDQGGGQNGYAGPTPNSNAPEDDLPF